LAADAARSGSLEEISGDGGSDLKPLGVLKEDLGIAGSARGAYFSKDLSSETNGFGVASLWMTARPKEVLGVKTYWDVRVQNQNLSRSGSEDWELREGYAETSIGALDIRAGRQITVWGRADRINPTDVWTTRDLTLLTSDDEDQRLGVSAVQAIWNKDGSQLIGYWQPEWRFPVYPNIPPVPPGITLENVQPSNSALQGGLKFDHSGGRIDYSISLASAISRAPDLSELMVSADGAQLGLQYRRITMAGADAAIVLGQFGLRAEAAYTDTQNRDGRNPLAQRNNFFGVLGADRTFWDALNVNVQFLFRHTDHWQDPAEIADPRTRCLALQESIGANQLARDMGGASTRINYTAFNQTLVVELAAATWFTRRDVALLPKLSYALSDHVKAVIGAQIYRGPEDSFFGRFKHHSAGFTEVRVGF
jgi:hypothetical protein